MASPWVSVAPLWLMVTSKCCGEGIGTEVGGQGAILDRVGQEGLPEKMLWSHGLTFCTGGRDRAGHLAGDGGGRGGQLQGLPKAVVMTPV